MSILSEAVDFASTSGQPALRGVSPYFFGGQVGLETLSSISITYSGGSSVIIKPKINLSRQGLEQLIERMIALNQIIDFTLDLSEWEGATWRDNIIDDELLRKIALMLGRLRGLSLPNDSYSSGNIVSAAELSRLAKLPFLKTLDLWNCSEIDGTGFAHIADLNSVRSLGLTWSSITNEQLAPLAKLTSLQALKLSECHSLFGPGLAHLKNLTSLKKLDLVGFNLGNEDLEYLKDLTSLQVLNLSHCNALSDAGLAHLTNLTSLQTLILKGANIANAGLAHLANLTSLETLDLRGRNQLTDAGLAHLVTLTSLKAVYLDGRTLNHAEILHIANQRNPSTSTLQNNASTLSLNASTHTDTAILHLASPHNPSLTTLQNNSSTLSMHILSGVITALGITAVAVAFTVLNAATFGALGLSVLALGVAGMLTGVGMFAATTGKASEQACETSQDATPLTANNLA